MDCPLWRQYQFKNLYVVRNKDKLQIADYCRGKFLRSIGFRNCLYATDIGKEEIVKLVNVVKDKQNEFPLCIKFDRITYFPMTNDRYLGNAYGQSLYGSHSETHCKAYGQSLNESSYEAIIQVIITLLRSTLP